MRINFGDFSSGAERKKQRGRKTADGPGFWNDVGRVKRKLWIAASHHGKRRGSDPSLNAQSPTLKLEGQGRNSDGSSGVDPGDEKLKLPVGAHRQRIKLVAEMDVSMTQIEEISREGRPVVPYSSIIEGDA